MSTQVRSPLKYCGGKHSAAERILAAFPPPHCYDTYVEPFGGAAHVLFAKYPYHHAEVYNDLSNNLYTFWYQLRDNAEVLQERVNGLLYSRAQYYDFYRSLFDGTDLSPLERAVRFFYCLRLTGTGWLRPSPVGWNCQHSNVLSFRTASELFKVCQERLRCVAIDNRDCIDTITRYDSPKTLFFCDPPYIDREQYYEASRNGFDHEALAKSLNRVEGYVVLSYYPHPLLDQLYPSGQWRRMTWQQKKSSALKLDEDGDIHTEMATEILIMNYSPISGGLFDL